MRYLLLVSHGTFAPGLHSVIDMLFGDHDDVLSCSLEDGMGADQYVEHLEEVIAPIKSEDEVVVLADIIGGSPLTNAISTLSQHGLLEHTCALGGMSLPMAIAALEDLQTAELAVLKDSILSQGKAAMYELELDLDDADEDPDDI